MALAQCSCIMYILKWYVYWNSVSSYKPWESVGDVMKCLGKKNVEFIYYERKLFFT